MERKLRSRLVEMEMSECVCGSFGWLGGGVAGEESGISNCTGLKNVSLCLFNGMPS